ncbi:Separin, partial [Armadillidium nasatum]
FFLQLMVSYPPSEATSSSKDFSAYDFSLKAGIALLLDESVRSTNVKSVFTSLMDLQKEFEDIRSSCRNPVILILDKAVVTLPWEMTHSLCNQPVTRMPSLPSLIQLYLKHSQKADSILTKGVDVNNGFFILDPDNNLPRTQERLRDTFSSTKWEGVKGERPSLRQFQDALNNKDIFV